MGLVLAAPMWRAGITTLADLFRKRYGGSVERFAALILIPASLLWSAAQVRAFDPLEDASGFASAGVLVVAVFGLFTRIGGPAAAMASPVARCVGAYAVRDFGFPFIASLGVALAAYVGGALLEPRLAAAR